MIDCHLEHYLRLSIYICRACVLEEIAPHMAATDVSTRKFTSSFTNP